MGKKQDLIPTLSSGEIGRLMTEVVERELKGWSDKGLLIRAYGVLTNLSAQRKFAELRKWQRVFGVVLDADGPLTVNAPKSLFEPFNDGDMIEIVGYPIINVFRGVISVQLEVQGARSAESDADQEKRRVVQSNLATLQSLKPSRNIFPLLPTVSVDVIHSSASSAQVDEDFYNGLGEQASRCNINAVPIRITSAQDIAAAIRASQAKVLVIIRGGGTEADFAVFNDAEVLSALAEKDSYRVMGIGHSGNTTLIDLIADFSARVPAEAGSHIRDHLRHVDDLVGAYEDALEQRGTRNDALAAELKKTQDESKAEISRLHDSMRMQKSQTQPSAKLLWLVIAVLVLILIFK